MKVKLNILLCYVLLCIWCVSNTNRYKLIGVVHHGDEEVEEHNHVDDGVRAEHQHAPEASKDFDPFQLKWIQIDQAKSRPEQSLHRLEQTDKRTLYLVREKD